MPSEKVSRDEIERTVAALIGFYPVVEASNKQLFTAGLVQLFSTYSRPTVMRAASPVVGLPSLFRRMPSIAEIKKQMDAWEMLCSSPFSKTIPGLLPRPPRTEAERARERKFAGPGAAERSQLCKRYGIRAVPQGWDAVDVARAAHQHGANFPAVVEAMLKDGTCRRNR